VLVLPPAFEFERTTLAIAIDTVLDLGRTILEKKEVGGLKRARSPC